MKKKKWKTFRFRVNYKEDATYEQPPTWEELTTIKGILPTDCFCGWDFKTEEITPMWSLDDERIIINYCEIIISREVEETDAEYYERMQYEEQEKKKKLDNEYLTYLKLKAKFEVKK